MSPRPPYLAIPPPPLLPDPGNGPPSAYESCPAPPPSTITEPVIPPAPSWPLGAALDLAVELGEETDRSAARIQELLEANNRSCEEARTARRETERARWEAEVWRERALSLQATLRRVDPVYVDPRPTVRTTLPTWPPLVRRKLVAP